VHLRQGGDKMQAQLVDAERAALAGTVPVAMVAAAPPRHGSAHANPRSPNPADIRAAGGRCSVCVCLCCYEQCVLGPVRMTLFAWLSAVGIAAAFVGLLTMGDMPFPQPLCLVATFAINVPVFWRLWWRQDRGAADLDMLLKVFGFTFFFGAVIASILEMVLLVVGGMALFPKTSGSTWTAAQCSPGCVLDTYDGSSCHRLSQPGSSVPQPCAYTPGRCSDPERVVGVPPDTRAGDPEFLKRSACEAEDISNVVGGFCGVVAQFEPQMCTNTIAAQLLAYNTSHAYLRSLGYYPGKLRACAAAGNSETSDDLACVDAGRPDGLKVTCQTLGGGSQAPPCDWYHRVRCDAPPPARPLGSGSCRPASGYRGDRGDVDTACCEAISDGEMQERQPALMQRDCGVLRRWLWQQSPTSQRGHLRLRFPILIFLLFFGFVDAAGVEEAVKLCAARGLRCPSSLGCVPCCLPGWPRARLATPTSYLIYMVAAAAGFSTVVRTAFPLPHMALYVAPHVALFDWNLPICRSWSDPDIEGGDTPRQENLGYLFSPKGPTPPHERYPACFEAPSAAVPLANAAGRLLLAYPLHLVRRPLRPFWRLFD
jgi:hypothetical protein